jgi:hypothetical protein
MVETVMQAVGWGAICFMLVGGIAAVIRGLL